jgi:hypothetical protein
MFLALAGLPLDFCWTNSAGVQCLLDQMVAKASKLPGKWMNSQGMGLRYGAFWKFFENAG